MLSVENLASAYGRIEVLHGVSMEVRSGEIVALVGANGAGKTTLLRAISGVQPITAGSIRFEGKPIEQLPAHLRVPLGISQVPVSTLKPAWSRASAHQAEARSSSKASSGWSWMRRERSIKRSRPAEIVVLA